MIARGAAVPGGEQLFTYSTPWFGTPSLPANDSTISKASTLSAFVHWIIEKPYMHKQNINKNHEYNVIL
jgi:hypothetical protein